MRQQGQRLHPDPRIRCTDDALPETTGLLRSGLGFDALLLSSRLAACPTRPACLRLPQALRPAQARRAAGPDPVPRPCPRRYKGFTKACLALRGMNREACSSWAWTSSSSDLPGSHGSCTATGPCIYTAYSCTTLESMRCRKGRPLGRRSIACRQPSPPTTSAYAHAMVVLPCSRYSTAPRPTLLSSRLPDACVWRRLRPLSR